MLELAVQCQAPFVLVVGQQRRQRKHFGQCKAGRHLTSVPVVVVDTVVVVVICCGLGEKTKEREKRKHNL